MKRIWDWPLFGIKRSNEISPSGKVRFPVAPKNPNKRRAIAIRKAGRYLGDEKAFDKKPGRAKCRIE